jgi:hypothetical protein
VLVQRRQLQLPQLFLQQQRGGCVHVLAPESNWL